MNAHDDNGNGNGHTASNPPTHQSQIPNQNSKIPDHPLGPDWISKFNAMVRHREGLEHLLVIGMTTAASNIVLAAAGHSPFRNEIQFRAACKLLEFLPRLLSPLDAELEALDRLDRRAAPTANASTSTTRTTTITPSAS